jgi:hypothetical protein
MADTCEARTGWYSLPAEQSLAGSWGCDQPATVSLRAGCVHEHVMTRRCCAEHGQVRPADAQWFCKSCAELGHDCPITPEVVPEAGAQPARMAEEAGGE